MITPKSLQWRLSLWLGLGTIAWATADRWALDPRPFRALALVALLMALWGIAIRVLKWTWLEQYAMPICMLGAMALSIPITAIMA